MNVPDTQDLKDKEKLIVNISMNKLLVYCISYDFRIMFNRSFGKITKSYIKNAKSKKRLFN